MTGERIRDKIAASKRKGMWMGGVVPLGYDLNDRHLVLNPAEAEHVKDIYRTYLKLGCVTKLQAYLKQEGIRSKKRMSRTGRASGGASYSRGALYLILHNRIYLGEITHKGTSYPGQHPAIIEQKLSDQVQLKFQSNLQAARKRPRATEQSLLIDLALRRARQSIHAVACDKEGPTLSILRIPASKIEELALLQLTLLLRSPQHLLDILVGSDASAADVRAITQSSREWNTATTDKVQSLLQSTVKRIVVHIRDK